MATSSTVLTDEAMAASLIQAANAIGGAILTIRDEPPLLEMVLTRFREELPVVSSAIFLHDGQRFTVSAQLCAKGQSSTPLEQLSPLTPAASSIFANWSEWGIASI